MLTAIAPSRHRPPALMTRSGYEQLSRELEVLRTRERRQMADRLRDARDHGRDPTENAELMEALRDSAELEERIIALEARLAAARVAGPAPADGTATVGSRVQLRGARGLTVEYVLVGAGEADPARRRISIDSPVGRAVAGRRAGDRVEVEAPTGRLDFRLEAVEPAEELALAA